MAETVNDFGEATTYGELAFKREVTKIIRDTTTQETIASLAAASVAWILVPKAGEIVQVGCVLHGALTTGNATLAFATDEAVAETFADVAAAATTLTQASSAAGTTFTTDLATTFPISANKVVRITNTPGSQDAVVTATVWVTVRSTELLLG